MTTRYFEYALSQGEGTLLQHRVCAGDMVIGYDAVDTAKDDESGIFSIGEISLQRYAEFITIHGSEVAV